MYFQNIPNFLHMGGYADYVWPAYGVALLVLLIYPLIAASKLRRLKNKLRSGNASQT